MKLKEKVALLEQLTKKKVILKENEIKSIEKQFADTKIIVTATAFLDEREPRTLMSKLTNAHLQIDMVEKDIPVSQTLIIESNISNVSQIINILDQSQVNWIRVNFRLT